MNLRKRIVSQFEHPRGLLGWVVGLILSGRGSNLKRNRWTVEQLALRPGEAVLEVGCGPGVALGLCLAQPGVRAVGVDHSALMIAQASRRNARAVKARRLRLIEGTVETMPADLGTFDKMFSINVIQFVDRSAFVARAKALVKPGGTLATTYQPRHAKAIRADALKMAENLSALLTQAGFGDVRTHELALKPVPAVCVVACRG